MEETENQKPPELFSISVRVRPLQSGSLPLAHGYHIFSLLLNIISTSDAPLAEKLHNDDAFKPFTVSPLIGKVLRTGAQILVSCDTALSLRLTFLDSAIFSHFMDGAVKWGNKPVNIAGIPFSVEEVVTAPSKDLTVSFMRYKEIVDRASALRQIDLEFITPTVFRSGGKRNNIFPEPSLVFGSYFNKWQALSPVKMSDGLVSFFDKISVTRYKLETRIWDFGSYQEVGFYGITRFEIGRNLPDDITLKINVLADFTQFCATGAKTTMGMGQTRRL